MPIDTACPECRKSYSLADTQRGKTVVCRDCKAQFVVEDEADRRPSRPPSSSSSRRDEEEEGRPSSRRPARRDEEEGDRSRRSRRDEEDDRPSRRSSRRDQEEDDRPRRSRRDEDDRARERDPDRRGGRRGRDEEEEDRRPSRKQKAGGGGMMLWLLLGGGGGLLLLIGVVVIILVTTGLGPSKVTVENYQKLKPGMSQKELEAILGTPRDGTNQAINEANEFLGPEWGKDMKKAGFKVLIWESGKDKIVVQMVQDRAVGFSGEFHGPRGAVTRMRN